MVDDTDPPLFSVIIPTYNRSEVVRSTLESVQSQTFPHFECIVVDDGSRDGDELAAVVHSMDDSRFRYVRQDNGGASSARNHGFELSKGRYIALLDSDDRFLPNKLEKCAEVLQRHGGEVLLYSQMIVERGMEKKWVRPAEGAQEDERIDEYILCTPGTIRTSTIVVSAALARRVRFDESLPWFQDSDFAIRAGNAGALFEFVDEPLIVLEDKVGYARVSRNASYAPLLAYFDRMRRTGEISDRAYWAGRGWPCARVASTSNRSYAVMLFAQAVVKRAFPLRHAIIVAAQVVVPYRLYQAIANGVVRIRGRRVA
ncbi:glycosyltransferase family 2 protein [Mycolicibacterium baixiangningiae]|uniref:glycosyltransferase family 2 protein n=1 Tax=Mycolicibacterium baixiangningiae TaxID=2761578 RepID=UPI001868633B|nr:glycosyltransferase [Mycolicibacterium baixiangningiae]